jgi:hypothetical protein
MTYLCFVRSQNMKNDTICALASPNGVGAIALIRVSGPEALKCFGPIFSKDLTQAASHTIHFGVVKTGDGAVIDEVLVSVFHSGKSFTGEEVWRSPVMLRPIFSSRSYNVCVHQVAGWPIPGNLQCGPS